MRRLRLIGSLLVKLNFDRCSLDNPEQLSIRAMIRDHWSAVLRAHPKASRMSSTIEVEIPALLEGLLQPKALGKCRGRFCC